MSGKNLIAGAVLAGGRSRRMGGVDKALLDLAGRPLIAHVIERLRPQVGALVISANGDPARFASLALPVVADTFPDRRGPLAGILAAMRWCASNTSEVRFVAIAPADAPFLPDDLVERLVEVADGGIAVAASLGRLHPVFGVFPVAFADRLEEHLRSASSLAVVDWLATQRVATVAFSGDPDPFLNINTPEDLLAAETILSRPGRS